MTDFTLTAKVAKRAAEMYADAGYRVGVFDLVMYLDAAHADVGLDLEGMLTGRLEDLAHDMGGIMKHLNKTTGKLEGTWTPRYAK